MLITINLVITKIITLLLMCVVIKTTIIEIIKRLVITKMKIIIEIIKRLVITKIIIIIIIIIK